MIAKHTFSVGADGAVALAMDRLAVNLGCEISKLVKGYVSTEVLCASLNMHS